MTTVQIVGIAVAAAVVALLVIALLVTRRRRDGENGPAPDEASFLDAAPQDTLDSLGRAETPIEDVTLDPSATRALQRDREDDTAEPSRARDDATLVPPGEPPAVVPAAASPATPEHDAAVDPESSLSLDWGPPAHEGGLQPGAAVSGAAAAEAGRRVKAGPEGSSPPEGRKVPLADIIVTTSPKVIDLDDPEVRRMLTDLVKFEIDQATRFREQGQHIDAVLQLTEAEKISRALGMNESADAIRLMMQDLEG